MAVLKMDDVHVTTTTHPIRSDSNRLLTYLGVFISQETENRFRTNTLKFDTTQARIALLISSAVILPVIWTDYLLLGISPLFWKLFVVRMTMLSISTCIWFLLATDSPKTWDRLLLAWSVLCGAFAVSFNATRPVGFLGPVIANVMILMASYLLMPLRLQLQLVLAGIVTIGQLVFSVGLKPISDVPLRNSVMVAFVAANLIGFFASRQLNQWKRLEFALGQKLRESESHYRTLVDASGSLVWTMRPDRSIDFVNKPWIEISGMPGSDDRLKDWSNIIHPDDLETFKSQFIEQLDLDKTTESIVRCLSQSGEYRWVLIRMVPILNHAGVSDKWIGTTTDINESWLAKLELQKANGRLEQALGRVTQLEKILPICSFCKNIRDENDTWQPVDAYISERSETRFTHGICPSCGLEHYGAIGKQVFGSTGPGE